MSQHPEDLVSARNSHGDRHIIPPHPHPANRSPDSVWPAFLARYSFAPTDPAGRAPPTPDHKAAARASHPGGTFPVVCIGGSAGGLDAYVNLLKHLPADTGAAFVIVNHMRHMATQLHEILPGYTAMPVVLITEGLNIRPDHLFIIPANRDLHIHAGQFEVRPISKPNGWPNVITVFLRSLIRAWSGQVFAVIVSGYDGDGADTLCEIRDAGGITIAQRPETAAAPDMPESAIGSGCIDFILSPAEIAGKIAAIARRA